MKLYIEISAIVATTIAAVSSALSAYYTLDISKRQEEFSHYNEYRQMVEDKAELLANVSDRMLALPRFDPKCKDLPEYIEYREMLGRIGDQADLSGPEGVSAVEIALMRANDDMILAGLKIKEVKMRIACIEHAL